MKKIIVLLIVLVAFIAGCGCGSVAIWNDSKSRDIKIEIETVDGNEFIITNADSIRIYESWNSMKVESIKVNVCEGDKKVKYKIYNIKKFSVVQPDRTSRK